MKRGALVIALLGACETTPYVTTSLQGTIPCGSNTCASGEICIDMMGGIDAAGGGGGSHMCFAVPKGCYVFNCHAERCAPCLLQQCTLCSGSITSGCDYVDVAGRNLYCPGQ